MSRRNSRNTGAKKEESSGLGFLGALAVAGGAAAIGYMANDLFKSFQQSNTPEQPHTSQSRQPPPTQPTMQQKEQARKNSTRQQKDDVAEAIRCVVCLDNQREYAFEPCGHVSVCMDCGDILQECPICKSRIEAKRLVYVS